MDGDSPISILPNELLAEIFLLSTSCYERAEKRKFRNPYMQQTIISSVCRRWRDAALSYQPLWCSVFSQIAKAWPPADLVMLYIERSGGSPLQISFQSICPFTRPEKSDHDQVTYFRALLTILLPEICRWTSFVFRQTRETSSSLLEPLSNIPFERAIVLRRAEIKVYPLGYRSEISVIDAIGKAPSLMILKWGSSGYNTEMVSRNFPWDRLVHFQFESVYYREDAFTVAACCTSVATMKIDCEWLGLSHIPENLTFPNIRALDISSNGPIGPEIFHIISSMNCPRLEVLILSLTHWGTRAALDEAFISTLRGFSRYPLRLLGIHAEQMPNRLLPTIFTVSSLANIPTLHISALKDRMWESDSVLSRTRAAIAQHLPKKVSSWRMVPPCPRGLIHAGWTDVEGVEALQNHPELRDIAINIDRRLLY